MILEGNETIHSYIEEYFSDDLLKALYLVAMDNSYPNNNVKAQKILDLIGPDFQELGPGTNRVVVKRDKAVFKIAMDRRGMVDNFTEFKRSPEVEMYCAKTYECNLLITVAEYVNLMDEQDYLANRSAILTILEDLSKAYVFEDMGYNMINRCNTGYRDNGDIVFLDYGYMYPITGNENALICKACGAMVGYNSTYTKFVCSNPSCKKQYRFSQIRNRMNLSLENEEDAIITNINALKTPDWNNLNKEAYTNGLLK